MTTRNLTDSFIFMRNNSIQNRQDFTDDHNSDRAVLLTRRSNDCDVEIGPKDDSLIEYNRISGSIQHDFARIQKKMKKLISLHDHHLNRACLDDNLDEDREIEIQTRELTQQFVEAHRKLSGLVASGRRLRLAGGHRAQMATNMQASHARTLQDLSVAFRKAESQYLAKLKSRDDRLKGLFELPQDDFSGRAGLGEFEEDSDGLVVGYYQHQQQSSLVLRQTQLGEENARVVQERENEINQICKSIQELNAIFRDVAQMVTVQGSVIDRIDYNISQTQFKVKEGLGQLQKAQKLQKKNRKMILIIALAVIATVLGVVLIATKFR